MGITLIAAYAPEARGRSERTFCTLQDRLPKKRVLAGITDMAAANELLRTRRIPAYNQRVAIPAATEPGTAFVPWGGANLADVLWVRVDRVVANGNNGNTVRYQGRRLQIPSDSYRFHYVKVTVRGYDYPAGTLAVFHGPRCLARYDAAGQLIEPEGACGHQKDSTVRSRDRLIVDLRATVRESISCARLKTRDRNTPDRSCAT